MKSKITLFVCVLLSWGSPGRAASAAANKAPSWNPTAAAAYLDARATWWVNWPKAQRDHDTTCISCHTVLPYLLSRGALKTSLHEADFPAVQQTMLRNLRKRVDLWNEVQPYYLDAKFGPGKSKESRSTEVVLNAFVLSSVDRQAGHLSETTRKAFDAAWALQIPSGENAGAWDWQQFHLSPWEAGESQYAGAVWMALATGWAPDHYRKDRHIQDHLRSLRSYLRREYAQQPLLNRVSVLWASQYLDGLLTVQEKRELLNTLREKQNGDGGWNLASLGTWKRLDQTREDSESDALATALIALALQTNRDQPARERGLAWLRTHQDGTDGSWRAYSLNKKRDPASDAGPFMGDAATGYAVLALQSSPK